jgi:hypothetical protein
MLRERIANVRVRHELQRKHALRPEHAQGRLQSMPQPLSM